MIRIQVRFFILILLLCSVSAGRTHAADVRSSRIVYVALGDSWTAGDGTDNPDKQSYPAVLAHHLPPGSRLLNLGRNGYTVQNALSFSLDLALRARPTLVTIWLCGNDVISSPPTPLSTYRPELTRLVSSLTRTHARLFIVNEPDPRIVPAHVQLSDPSLIKNVRAYNGVIAAVGRRYGASIVDVFAATKSLWGHSSYVYSDGEHLTARGYAALAQVFYRVMLRHGVFK